MNIFLDFLENYKLNSSKKYLDDFAKEAAKKVDDNNLVLDVGAGGLPYKHYFTNVIYESTYFYQSNHDGSFAYKYEFPNIPVQNAYYDLIICFNTLEHLSEPKKALKEFHRILKPGGSLWIATSLFTEEHETAQDFYRFTQNGLTYLLKSVGFKVRKIESLEGYYGTLSYQLDVASRHLPSDLASYGKGLKSYVAGFLITLFLKPSFALLSIVFAHLDVRNRFVVRGHCKNYRVIVRKPKGIQKKNKMFWADLDNHSPSWDKRERAISALIPSNSSVFEFGAGRLALKDMLDQTCVYHHHDIVQRNEETFVFDLNSRPFPHIPKHDIAVFSGVLEYIEDVPSLIQEISDKFHKIIISYVLKDLYPDQKSRDNNGWINAFEEAELTKIFEANGYTLRASKLYDDGAAQKIFLFEKAPSN